MMHSAAESQAMQRLTPPIACLIETVELKPLTEKRTLELHWSSVISHISY